MRGLFRNVSRDVDQWYRFTLDAKQIDAYEVARLRLVFGALYTQAFMPAQMRLWLQAREDGSADLYMSPSAQPHTADIREKYTARPCPEPDVSDCFLVAGDESQMSLFPRSTQCLNTRPAGIG